MLSFIFLTPLVGEFKINRGNIAQHFANVKRQGKLFRLKFVNVGITRTEAHATYVPVRITK